MSLDPLPAPARQLRPMRRVVCGRPAPSTPTMRRRWRSHRCRLLATWPCIPLPRDHNPATVRPISQLVLIWPAVPPTPPIPVEVERWCVDRGEPLPEPTGPGRPFTRCDACPNPEPVRDRTRPFRVPNGEDDFEPWLREQLQAPRLPWER